MFKESFNARVDKVLVSKVKDEDGGVQIDMRLSMVPTEDQFEEMGAEISALVNARKEGDGTRVHPFKKITLDTTYSDLRMSVYSLEPALDKPHQVKFDVDGCKAKKLELKKGPYDATIANLSMAVIIPPIKVKDRDYLISAIDSELRFALTYPQMEMDVQ